MCLQISLKEKNQQQPKTTKPPNNNKQTEPEITIERQNISREGWVTDTFDLQAHLSYQETRRLPKEKPYTLWQSEPKEHIDISHDY